MPAFVKTRARAEPGSIPDVLDIFHNELRFYREIAPVVGVRTPALLGFDSTSDHFTLQLEDLSSWREGGEPVVVACELKMLHERWQGEAERQWPWLNRSGRAAELIGDLYDGVWRELRDRSEFSPNLLTLGDSLAGSLAGLEREESVLPHRTLIHGDAALRNVRTSPTGEIALLDWEDVRVSQGEVDLAWLLVSSVEGDLWSAVLEAYSPQLEDSALLSAARPPKRYLASGIIRRTRRRRSAGQPDSRLPPQFWCRGTCMPARVPDVPLVATSPATPRCGRQSVRLPG